MNALIISSLYPRPGKLTGHAVHRQCVEIARLGISVQVICPIPRLTQGRGISSVIANFFGTPSFEVLDGIPVAYVPYFNIPHAVSPRWDGARLTQSLWATLRETRFSPDLIHAHRLFPTGYASQCLAGRTGLPLVVTVHGSDIHSNPKENVGIRSCTADVLSKSDAILTVSASLANEVVEFGSPCNPIVGYLGVDTEVFRPIADRSAARRRLNLPEDGVVICMVSRLTADKGVHELIKAFHFVSASLRGGCWLVVVGDGPERSSISREVSRRGLGNAVFLVGPKGHTEVPSWLQASDIFVLPSKKEGLPNCVLEGMASGLPIIATRVGGIPEAVGPECGFLVEPEDLDALRAAIGRLVRSSSLRATLGRNARRRAVEKYSWSVSAKRVVQTYKDVLGKTCQSPQVPHRLR